MTLRQYESAFPEHFILCLTLLNHHALQRGRKHVRILPILQHEMALISYIKGDHLIIPGALDQGATAERGPMLFFLDERRWMEGIPLHRLQSAWGFSVPAHHWGTTPSHRAQKANIETITKTKTYPWNRHVSSHPRLSSLFPQSFREGRVFEPASEPVVTFKLTRDWKVCSLSSNKLSRDKESFSCSSHVYTHCCFEILQSSYLKFATLCHITAEKILW